MPTLGSKKKESQPRLEKPSGDVMPQLSNEMQLSIMNKVKSGELSIEDALNRARMDGQLLRQKSREGPGQTSVFYATPQKEQEPTQYNFSVHKHSRYRWQKRVLQIDFKTKLLCSIERGIVKRQLPFSIVKSCDDGENSRFSISFKGHHDYELEATSLDDKHKIMQLVNQIIYGNIYQDPAGDDRETEQQQQHQAPQCLRDGVLLLHRGGLASFKWVKYEVQLHPGQLTLVRFRRRAPADGEMTASVPVPIVIHLSHGDTTVQKQQSLDSFTLITHKNEYWFKVPLSDETSGTLQKERDAWVHAIHKLCSNWKRKSMGEHMFPEAKSLRHISIAEDPEDDRSDLELSGGSHHETTPPNEQKSGASGWDHSSAGDTSPTKPAPDPEKPDPEKPVPTPRSKTSAPSAGPDSSPLAPSPTAPSTVAPTSPTSSIYATPVSPRFSPPSAAPSEPTSSPTVPVPSTHQTAPSDVKEPPQPHPFIPAPPPLPIKLKRAFNKRRTKAFHWDLVGPEKIAKSFWKQESTRRIEIDTSRLYEQFAVKDPGTFAVAEPSNTQHIMLNEKIAHNFNIFLKSFPVQPGELKDKLFVINEEDGGLSDEHITSLRRYVPTVEDVEMYKSHSGPVSELHIVDQYMMAMCNIPYLSTQLDLLLTLRELPISMNDLQPLINQKIRMCTQLYNCGSFVSVLEYLLAIGNYLNENAGKGKAKGFRLSSLPKLCQLRGTDKKFTLLHALVEQIMLHEPKLAAFTQDLAEFETVPGASIKGLTAEVDVLKNELQKVVQYRKTTKKRNGGDAHPNFFKDLKVVIDKYNADLSALTKTCDEMKKLYSVILVKFGEPADQDSQELFGMICQFVQDFRRTQAETV